MLFKRKKTVFASKQFAPPLKRLCFPADVIKPSYLSAPPTKPSCTDALDYPIDSWWIKSSPALHVPLLNILFHPEMSHYRSKMQRINNFSFSKKPCQTALLTRVFRFCTATVWEEQRDHRGKKKQLTALHKEQKGFCGAQTQAAPFKLFHRSHLFGVSRAQEPLGVGRGYLCEFVLCVYVRPSCSNLSTYCQKTDARL